MCGLAGWAGPRDAGTEELARMCESLAHRGPDEQGVHIFPGEAALGFRRLSIIDLVTGSQPLLNEDETVAVMCNGEIYNFQALRAELEARGHRFRSSSDTEVIVHLYEDAGGECMQRLQGMFAIALWDSRRQRLLLARDRLGVKPLYWTVLEPDGVAFASGTRCVGRFRVCGRHARSGCADAVPLAAVRPGPAVGHAGDPQAPSRRTAGSRAWQEEHWRAGGSCRRQIRKSRTQTTQCLSLTPCFATQLARASPATCRSAHSSPGGSIRV